MLQVRVASSCCKLVLQVRVASSVASFRGAKTTSPLYRRLQFQIQSYSIFIFIAHECVLCRVYRFVCVEQGGVCQCVCVCVYTSVCVCLCMCMCVCVRVCMYCRPTPPYTPYPTLSLSLSLSLSVGYGMVCLPYPTAIQHTATHYTLRHAASHYITLQHYFFV